MKRVAVFGNTGAGKSTLARRLAEKTGLPLHPLDLIQFGPGGEPVPHEEYLRRHAGLMERKEWIIDGFGDVKSAWERFAAADTLIHIDLPIATHYWWVTKRFLKAAVVAPEGWPANSPLWASTLNSYRVVQRCHQHLTPRYRQLLIDEAGRKECHHLRSPAEIRAFLDGVK